MIFISDEIKDYLKLNEGQILNEFTIFARTAILEYSISLIIINRITDLY